MTIEKAIDYLKMAAPFRALTMEKFLEFDEAICMAIKALEKQTPKKPIRIDKNKEFDGNWKKICPLCGRVLMERITTSERSYPRHYNYTGHCWCGQAIDWEDES